MTKRDRIKVIQVASKIREVAENIKKKGGWSSDLCGACAISSYFLARELRKLGYNARTLYDSYEVHCWVEINPGTSKELIVDVTATQFGVRNKIYRPRRDRSNVKSHKSDRREQIGLDNIQKELGGFCNRGAWNAFEKALKEKRT